MRAIGPRRWRGKPGGRDGPAAGGGRGEAGEGEVDGAVIDPWIWEVIGLGGGTRGLGDGLIVGW